MAEALTIRVRRERDCPVVTVAGEIDIATVTRLRERLFELAAGGRPLIADLDQVSFIDSAGLGALVAAATRAAAHGGSLQVVCARPQVRQLFRLTGLDRRIPLARTWTGSWSPWPQPGTLPASSQRPDDPCAVLEPPQGSWRGPVSSARRRRAARRAPGDGGCRSRGGRTGVPGPDIPMPAAPAGVPAR